MERLNQLAYRLMSMGYSIVPLTREILEGDGATLLEMLKMQLLEGKQGNGEDLRPLYSEDLKANGGFFNSPQSAARYAAWKGSMSYPYNVPRNEDAPNLYIAVGSSSDGRFHSELGVTFDAEHFMFVGTTAYAQRIMAKYNEASFGLTDEMMATYNNTRLLPNLRERIKEYLQNG